MFEECVHIPKDPSVTNKSDSHASLPNVLQRQVVHGYSEAVMFQVKQHSVTVECKNTVSGIQLPRWLIFLACNLRLLHQSVYINISQGKKIPSTYH